MSEPLMEVRDLAVHVQGAERGWRGRSTASRSTGGRARSSAWSASRAAASRRWRGRCSGSSSRPPARWLCTATGCDGRSQTWRELRRRVQMIFQDPYQTLNPRQRVEAIVTEPLVVQGVGRSEREERVRAGAGGRRPRPGALPRPLPAPALRRPAPAGGDRRGAGARARRADLRRAGLDARRLGARADPRRAAASCSERRGLALLFITHDLSLAWSLCDRLAVMYLGRVVEQGSAVDVIERPRHPYTQALVDAVPVPTAGGGRQARAARRRAARRHRRAERAAASTPAARGASSPATGSTRRWSPTGGREQLAACLLHDPEPRPPKRSTAGDG